MIILASQATIYNAEIIPGAVIAFKIDARVTNY